MIYDVNSLYPAKCPSAYQVGDELLRCQHLFGHPPREGDPHPMPYMHAADSNGQHVAWHSHQAADPVLVEQEDRLRFAVAYKGGRQL